MTLLCTPSDVAAAVVRVQRKLPRLERLTLRHDPNKRDAVQAQVEQAVGAMPSPRRCAVALEALSAAEVRVEQMEAIERSIKMQEELLQQTERIMQEATQVA